MESCRCLFLETWGAFHLSELGGRTITRPVSQQMKFCFYHGFLLKNHLLRAYYLGFDLSGWIVLIKSEILTTTGMVWLVSSDKWKVPLEMKFRWIKGRIRERKGCNQKSLDEKIGASQKARTSYQVFIHMTKCKINLFAKHFLGHTSSYLIHNKYRYCAFSQRLICHSTWFSESHKAFSGSVPTESGRHSNLKTYESLSGNPKCQQ